MRTGLWRSSFIAYWAIFALVTLRQARFPGMMADLDEWTYPWGAVLIVWLLLAIFVGLLYGIIRPTSYNRSWRRLVGAIMYSVGLFVLAALTFFTDMPGYYYVLAAFAVFNLILMLLFAVTQAVSFALRRGRETG